MHRGESERTEIEFENGTDVPGIKFVWGSSWGILSCVRRLETKDKAMPFYWPTLKFPAWGGSLPGNKRKLRQ
jgi:hypothetical protein